MRQMTTLTLLILATLLWGVWGIADKYAVGSAHPFSVQWMYTLPFLFAMPVWYWLGRNAQPETNHDPTALAWAVVAGLASMFAMLLLLFALQRKPASLAVAFTSAYPVVTLFIAVLLGAEKITLLKAGGMLLVLAGLFVLQWSEG
jgi:bacterial/archaeal transporter family protein